MMKKRIVALMVIGAALLMSSPAFAHTFLERSWPRGDSQIAQAPTQVRLLFSERVEPALVHLTLTDATLHALALGEVSVDPENRRLLVARIAAPLPAGAYAVTWRVVAADGHPSEGQFHFTVAP